MEKDNYVVEDWHELKQWPSRPASGDPAYMVEQKGLEIGEATDIFGDLQTAEDYGYVNRGLKSRHIQFIALGGTIGTGLFLGIGRAFTQAGPLSLLLGYTVTGCAIYAMMMSLGEMATWLPLPGAIPQFCSRYVDPAMGFAVGWNSWYQAAITVCAEISAAAVIIQYWEGAKGINVAAWITLIIGIIIALNIFAVSIYGEAEFCFASIKLVTIIGLLIFAIVIDLGGGPKHDRLGFRYWEKPGAMKEFLMEGPTGRFLGLWSTLVNAAFSYGGVEMVAVAAGEAENPRYNIPKAVRRVFWRILFFYILGSLAIGVLLPYDDERLLNAQKLGRFSSAASPWVVAAQNAGVRVLPSIINAVVLTSATSSANAFLYTGSRYLYALAQNGQAPRVLLTCSKRGIPYYCIAITASVSLLTYMASSSGSSTVFTWFQNLVTIANLFIWMSVSIAYIRFHAALKAQGVDRSLFGNSCCSDHHSVASSATLVDGQQTWPQHNRQQDSHNAFLEQPPSSTANLKSSLSTFRKSSLHHHNPLNCNPHVQHLHPPPGTSDRASGHSTAPLTSPSSLSPTDPPSTTHAPDYHMPFRSPWQPYLAYFSLLYFALVTLFNGFYVFPSSHPHRPTGTSSQTGPQSTNSKHPSSKGFDVNDFVTSYAGVPIYFAMYLGWKVWKRTKVVKATEADIWTGKKSLDAVVWERRRPRNLVERVWFWLA